MRGYDAINRVAGCRDSQFQPGAFLIDAIITQEQPAKRGLGRQCAELTPKLIEQQGILERALREDSFGEPRQEHDRIRALAASSMEAANTCP